MYFDAVLTDDLEPIFNGTPEEVAFWLEQDNADRPTGFVDPYLRVCEGRTLRMMSVEEYLARR